MHTDIGNTFAAEAVTNLLAHGRQLAHQRADEKLTQEHIAKVQAKAERVTGATRWVQRMLPCLPDGNPSADLVNGNPGVIFTWPGLTLGLVGGPAGMASPFVYVLDADGAVLGDPQMMPVLPADVTASYAEGRRNELAAWVATQADTGPRPAPAVKPQPERRRITPSEARFLDAVRQFIVDNTPEAF